MAWIELSEDGLWHRMAELQRIVQAGGGPGSSGVVAEVLAGITREVRAAAKVKNPVHSDPDKIPDELEEAALAIARYRACGRVPGAAKLIDSVRENEWREGLRTLDKLREGKVAIELPDEADQSTSEFSPGGPSPTFSGNTRKFTRDTQSGV